MGGIALNVEQAGDGHTAGLHDATQIIAEHIHVLFDCRNPLL